MAKKCHQRPALTKREIIAKVINAKTNNNDYYYFMTPGIESPLTLNNKTRNNDKENKNKNSNNNNDK